jgi:hypothetical protein
VKWKSSLREWIIDRMRARRTEAIGLLLLLLVPNASMRRGEKEFELSKGKAGLITAGMTIDELYAAVGRGNTKLVDRFAEGFFTPAIEIYLPEGLKTKPSVVTEVVGQYPRFRVGRITVYDVRFKTEKGVGVGSTLGEIRRNYQVDWIGFGEGPLFARVEQIGMSFALDNAKPPREWYKTHNPELISDAARVVSILVATEMGLQKQR